METKMGGRLGISGTLEWRDKDGNILGTTTLSGSIPLSEIENGEQLAEELKKGADHGCNDRK